MKKLVSILLVVAMLLTSAPFALVASAKETLISDPTAGISLSVATETVQYNWGDEICFDITVTNDTDEQIKNLNVSTLVEGYMYYINPKDDDNYVVIDSLLPGETKTVQKVFVAEKASIFVRIFAWPVYLFWCMYTGFYFNVRENLSYITEESKIRIETSEYSFGFQVANYTVVTGSSDSSDDGTVLQ